MSEQSVYPVKCTVPAEEVTRIKGLGFLWDKTTPDCFNARVITRNGKITAEECEAVAESARRFGSGEVAMTTRLTMEVQRIPYANIEPFCAFLAQHGLETGGTGKKVRPVVSCKGTTCQYGLIDTYGLSLAIHERFYKGMREEKLPHKFKIAVGGCPNNCVKPELNDVGIVGQRYVEIDYDKCHGCKACQIEKTCPMKAAQVKDGKITVDYSVCTRCGRCFGKCPFGVFAKEKTGYRFSIGGRWGKKSAKARSLNHLFESREEVMDTIERAILLFRDEGLPGERFADTIERLGFENVEARLLNRQV